VAIGAKPTDHRSHRREFVAEPLGDAIDRFIVDEDGSEGLVPAVEGLLGLEEESAVVTPLHDAASRTLIIFRPGTAVERSPKDRAEKGAERAPARAAGRKGRG
jgi:hypothetical protein